MPRSSTREPGKGLAQRASDAARGVEERPVEGPTLQSQIQRMQEQFQMAMPRGVEAQQLVRDALTAVRQNPNLAKCDAPSVLGALMTCAQLGLRVGVLGHAWVLPFYDTKARGYRAQLVIGYQGMCELAYRSDQVASITARTVYANDPVFEVIYGTEDVIKHRPNLTGDRGEPIAYYCVVHIKGGRPMFFVMSHPDMEDYRDKYAMAKTKDGRIVGPWRDQFEGMAHKTCLRQLAKWMPKATDLAAAVAVDDGIRVDITQGARPEEATVHVQGEVTGRTEDPDPGPPDAGPPRQQQEPTPEQPVVPVDPEAPHPYVEAPGGGCVVCGLPLDVGPHPADS